MRQYTIIHQKDEEQEYEKLVTLRLSTLINKKHWAGNKQIGKKLKTDGRNTRGYITVYIANKQRGEKNIQSYANEQRNIL